MLTGSVRFPETRGVSY